MVNVPISRAFISAPSGTDLTIITAVLDSLFIGIVDPADSTNKAIDAVAKADLFIAVLDDEHQSANTLFELGCAYALKKDILLVVQGNRPLPTNLHGLFSIRTTANNKDALTFALQQVLTRIKPAIQVRTGSRTIAKLIDKQRLHGLRQELTILSATGQDSDVERFVEDMLGACGIEIRARPRDRGPDFVILVAEVERDLGNPIVVEVRKEVRTFQAKRLGERLEKYMKETTARTALVFSMEIGGEALFTLNHSPSVYAFKLHDFLIDLDQKRFGRILLDARNARVHGIGP
jgi:hypothetical protein